MFNRASTGLYFEGLLKNLGLEAATAPKTTCHPDGASVMVHVLHGWGSELGIGAITEIVLVRGEGLQLVGPLPPGLQNPDGLRRSSHPAAAGRRGARAAHAPRGHGCAGRLQRRGHRADALTHARDRASQRCE